MRTHGAASAAGFEACETKVGMVWGSFFIAAAALKTPTRNDYNAQNFNFKLYLLVERPPPPHPAAHSSFICTSTCKKYAYSYFIHSSYVYIYTATKGAYAKILGHLVWSGSSTDAYPLHGPLPAFYCGGVAVPV